VKPRALIAILCCITSLGACSSFKEAMRDPDAAAKPVTRLTLLPVGPVGMGTTTSVDTKLTVMENRALITEDNLMAVRSQKLQLLALDPSFTDFQQITPQPTRVTGLYNFSFTPRVKSGYRVWADIIPTLTSRREFPFADLGSKPIGAFDRTEKLEAIMQGYHFTLAFDSPLERDNESTGMISATRSGEAAALALTEVFGFYDDFRTVIHLYPDEASRPAFQLRPHKKGFIRFFARVSVDGKDMVVPFTSEIRNNL
jgi:hypothetical protein